MAQNNPGLPWKVEEGAVEVVQMGGAMSLDFHQNVREPECRRLRR